METINIIPNLCASANNIYHYFWEDDARLMLIAPQKMFAMAHVRYTLATLSIHSCIRQYDPSGLENRCC